MTGSISGATLTVTNFSAGVLTVGQTLTGAGVASGTAIIALGSGAGGTGTYTLNLPQTAASTTLTVNPAGANQVVGVSAPAGGVQRSLTYRTGGDPALEVRGMTTYAYGYGYGYDFSAEAAGAKKFKTALATDFLDYGSNLQVDRVICLVYDPGWKLKAPGSFQADLSGAKTGLERVEVILSPPRD